MSLQCYSGEQHKHDVLYLFIISYYTYSMQYTVPNERQNYALCELELHVDEMSDVLHPLLFLLHGILFV